MDEIRVSTWAELHEQLYTDSWHEELGRHRSNYAFRGRWDAADDLSTSLMKLGGDAPTLEGHLVRNFRKYAGARFGPGGFALELALARAAPRLPTRMLDWTYSPYVALHFATAKVECFDRNGAIWMVDYVHAHEHIPQPLRECLKSEGANVLTTEMLSAVARDVGDLAKLGGDFTVFVERRRRSTTES